MIFRTPLLSSKREIREPVHTGSHLQHSIEGILLGAFDEAIETQGDGCGRKPKKHDT